MRDRMLPVEQCQRKHAGSQAGEREDERTVDRQANERETVRLLVSY